MELRNPFGGPVYLLDTVSSTMDEARLLAQKGEPHGTVVSADFQELGRGRIPGRPWNADRGKNLFFTLLLRYADYAAIPQALTLKTGLALALALEDFIRRFVPSFSDMIEVKWPNDVMLRGRKMAGILTEGDGTVVFVGIGVNVLQTEFSGQFRTDPTSVALALAPLFPPDGVSDADLRFCLLEMILSRLNTELYAPDEGLWRARLEARLYRRNELVRFIPGVAEAPALVEGLLAGIGPSGELLIVPQGQTVPLSFFTGEFFTSFFTSPPGPLPKAETDDPALF